MPSACKFNLNKINGVYFSGETIEGTIVLETTSPKDVRDVSIIFKGEGKVKWEKRRNKHTTYFKSTELYVDNRSCVHGDGILPPGSHCYTFFITLPEASPTSLEGRHGHIRYELTLKLDRPYRFDNVFSKPITVIKPVDLNLMPSYRFPIEHEEITRASCWSCSKGKVYYTFRVPFGGYTCGQAIKYTLNIRNQTMSDLHGYSIEFYKKMTFTARTPHYKTREVITSLDKRRNNTSCLHLTTRHFEGEYVIPPTMPSINGDCIIAVEYALKVLIHLGTCDVDSEVSIPIFVGTVPLRESLVPIVVTENADVTENTHLVEVGQPTAPALPLLEDDDAIANNLPPSYSDLAPPTFEEATRSNSPFVDTDRDERHRNTGFRPLYPMYSNNSEYVRNKIME